MNIASVKFKGIESNIYTRTKQQIQQTTKVSSKDTVEISDLGKYLNKINSSEDKDRLEKINEIKRKIENNEFFIFKILSYFCFYHKVDNKIFLQYLSWQLIHLLLSLCDVFLIHAQSILYFYH